MGGTPSFPVEILQYPGISPYCECTPILVGRIPSVSRYPVEEGKYSNGFNK